MAEPNTYRLQRQIRNLILIVIAGLILSGLTAFPIQWQLSIAYEWIQSHHLDNDLTKWIAFVHQGVTETYAKYPFIGYGTDWLAFAHLVIAVAFIGPLRDPVKNVWVIEFGMIACVAIFPLAFIAGPIRGIPFYWQLIDCSFGLIGGLVLWLCHRKIKSVAKNIDMHAAKEVRDLSARSVDSD
jgi:hypothetical protein